MIRLLHTTIGGTTVRLSSQQPSTSQKRMLFRQSLSNIAIERPTVTKHACCALLDIRGRSSSGVVRGCGSGDDDDGDGIRTITFFRNEPKGWYSSFPLNLSKKPFWVSPPSSSSLSCVRYRPTLQLRSLSSSSNTNNSFDNPSPPLPPPKTTPNQFHEYDPRRPGRLVVSILGPPNAGKSTLFNRMMCKESNRSYRLSSEKDPGRRNRRSKGRISSKPTTSTKQNEQAIVSSIPGTTRDRRECIGRIGSTKFTLVDTAGVDAVRISKMVGTTTSLSRKKHLQKGGNVVDGLDMEEEEMEVGMVRQTLEAAKQSDLVLLMFDARVGVTEDMTDVVRWLRKIGARDAGDLGSVAKIPSLGEDRDQNYNNQGSVSHRPPDRKVFILANKLEGDGWVDMDDGDSSIMEHLAEIPRLGFGEALPVSAEYGEGLADVAVLIEKMTRKKRADLGLDPLEEEEEERGKRGKKIEQVTKGEEEEENESHDTNSSNDANAASDCFHEKPLQLAILGRQNVGKSTLVNSLLCSAHIDSSSSNDTNDDDHTQLPPPRVLSGPTPGLTRDAIHVPFTWNSRPVRIVDTAGIRRTNLRDPSGSIEDAAVYDANRAMKTADVAALVLDGGVEGGMLQRQELAIADAVVREGRALVIVANKMDLLLVDEEDGEDGGEDGYGSYTAEDYARDVRRQIETRFPTLRNVPVIPMCSKSGEGVEDLMPVVFTARDRWERVVPTGVLNRWLADAVELQPPPMRNGRATKIKYILQTKGRPPTFLLFCNNNSGCKAVGGGTSSPLPDSYVRYLVRNLQESFGMFGMGVRIAIKSSASNNPFQQRSGKSNGLGWTGGIGGKKVRKERTLHELRTTGRTTTKKGKKRRFQKK